MVVNIPKGRINARFDVVLEENKEDPEVGGYFAYRAADVSAVGWKHRSNLWRGFGDTPLEAVVCLCCVLAEQDGSPEEMKWVRGNTTGYV